MLKFTAELSQQFRRASSVSSLKAYHISKSATKPSYAHFSIPKHRVQHNNPQPRMYDPPMTTGYQTCQHQFYRSAHKPLQTFYHKARTPHYTHAQYSTCPQQKFNQTQPTRHQYWSTPKRIHQEPNPSFRKQPSTNSVTKFYKTYKNEKKQELTVQPQPNLSELNPNSIKIDEDSKIRKVVNNIYPQGSQNDSTVRKASYLEKANNAAKMRISSINSLQNIQKRIQATLGQQNHLRI